MILGNFTMMCSCWVCKRVDRLYSVCTATFVDEAGPVHNAKARSTADSFHRHRIPIAQPHTTRALAYASHARLLHHRLCACPCVCASTLTTATPSGEVVVRNHAFDAAMAMRFPTAQSSCT